MFSRMPFRCNAKRRFVKGPVMVQKLSGLERVEPPQPRKGSGTRLVLAAHPAVVAQFVEQVEEEGIVQLPGTPLVLLPQSVPERALR